MIRLSRTDLRTGPMVLVTLSDGTEEVDERVRTLAAAEAQRSGLRLGAWLGILDEPEAGTLCHVFSAERI